MKLLVLNYSYERFISDIQYLELIKDLIIGTKVADQGYRAALYLSDQFVEIMMFRLLRAQIKSDSELVAIFQPQINQDEILEMNRLYDKKVKLLFKLKYISSQDVEKIKFVHIYRNFSYHNETGDETVFPAIASLGLTNAVKLFERYYSIIKSKEYFGFDAVLSLQKYSLPTDRIDYINASMVIKNSFKKGLFSKEKIEKIFKNGLKRRLQIISDKRKQLSWLRDDTIFNYWIKVVEFFETHPHDKFSQKVYEINYEIIRLTRGGRKRMDYKAEVELRRRKKLREVARDRKIQKLLSVYKQKVSSASISWAKNFIESRQPNLSVCVSRYKEIDKQIRALEFLIEIIEEDLDRRVQEEVDYRRGK